MKTITAGKKLAITFRPFLSPGVAKLSDVDPTIEAMGCAIDNRYKKAIEILEALEKIGIVTSVNHNEFNSIVNKARIALADLKEIVSTKTIIS